MHSFTIYKKRNFYPTMKSRPDLSESSSLRPSSNFFKNDSVSLPDEDQKLNYSSNLEPLPVAKESKQKIVMPMIEEQRVFFEECPILNSSGAFSLVLCEPLYVNWVSPGKDLVKFVIHNKNLVLYDKNAQQSYGTVLVQPQHEIRIKDVSISFLSQSRFHKFMVVIFSISSKTGKVRQHTKAVVATDKSNPCFHERVDLRNEILGEGEHDLYVGVMSKSSMKGLLNVSIHTSLTKEKTKNSPLDSFQKHFKKIM